jgi:hypothetical protein
LFIHNFYYAISQIVAPKQQSKIFLLIVVNLDNLAYDSYIPQRKAYGTLRKLMKRTYIFPDQFAHQIFTSVNFSGMDCAVIVAFDDPDDAFVFIAHSLHNITYDLNPSESMRMTNLANEMMERT